MSILCLGQNSFTYYSELRWKGKEDHSSLLFYLFGRAVQGRQSEDLKKSKKTLDGNHSDHICIHINN